mmetsp:Transcript_20554/g.69904  ORF Transcript_20554/g.69904 Transcript_20554/m.69904 type:complete len:292 (-) Transcript_20554:252-1127(-)
MHALPMAQSHARRARRPEVVQRAPRLQELGDLPLVESQIGQHLGLLLLCRQERRLQVLNVDGPQLNRRDVRLGQEAVLRRHLLVPEAHRLARAVIAHGPRLRSHAKALSHRIFDPHRLEFQPALKLAGRVQVLELHAPRRLHHLARAGDGAHGHVGVHPEAALLHGRLGYAGEAQELLRRPNKRRRLRPRAHVGLGHHLQQRHAGAVEVQEGALPAGPVRGLARVRLHLHARDPDTREHSAHDSRVVFLRHLVAVREVRVRVVLAVPALQLPHLPAYQQPEFRGGLERAGA